METYPFRMASQLLGLGYRCANALKSKQFSGKVSEKSAPVSTWTTKARKCHTMSHLNIDYQPIAP